MVKAQPEKKRSSAKRRSSKSVQGGRERMGQIELLRMRVAAAELTWKQAKEHANQAKRRRKLARLLAKRARKDARRAKENLDEIRTVLAEAEAKAATAGHRPARRKTVRSKPVAATAKKRVSPIRRRKQPPPSAVAAGAESLKEPVVPEAAGEAQQDEVAAAENTNPVPSALP